MNTELWKFYIAGVRFHKLHTVIDQINKEDRLSLKLEPENEVDPNAVGILYENIMIGYIPRRISAHVKAFMANPDIDIICEVINVNPDESPWKQIRVKIFYSREGIGEG